MPDQLLTPGHSLFPKPLMDAAADVLGMARQRTITLSAVETVTSGLLSACLTSVSGASEVFERAHILYHSTAKATGLGVQAEISSKHGAVSAEVTRALADGLLANCRSAATVAVTGYAGPGGGNEKNPVGTIFIATADRTGRNLAERHVFDGSRDEVRLQAVLAAIKLLKRQIA